MANTPLVPLTAQDYDEHYFGVPPIHPAGYQSYERWKTCNKADFVDQRLHDIARDQGIDYENCGHEYFRTHALKIFKYFNLAGKKVLDLGCAKGFYTNDLNQMGAICTGVDWSPITPTGPNFVKMDALDFLTAQPTKSFDLIMGIRFLPCVAPGKLAQMVTQAKRVGKNFYLTVDTDTSGSPPQYYNVQNYQTWLQTNFPNVVLQTIQEQQSWQP